MAVSTFGVTESVVLGYYPQIQVRADGPITSDRMTEFIENSASRVNGLLSAAGYSPTDIEDASATDPDPYNNVRALIIAVIGPLLYGAAEGYTVSSEEVATMELRRDKALMDFRKSPAVLGHKSDSGYSPKVRCSARYNDFSTAEADRAKRNQFGRMVGRTSAADRKPKW